MPRAYPISDFDDQARTHEAGDWQALRGELVALLDKVESHYGHPDIEPPEAATSGLARRVRHLRDQVTPTPEPVLRRREALRTVKRAVDRFSERDGFDQEVDDLTAAISEIRNRQVSAAPAPARRSADMPEIRELGSLVGGMSQRLERLEGELKTQRSSATHVREVASQVEQLTQVVELLAGAIGETGQVKRLEAQIAALGAMIEEAPRTELSAINARLDDVSATVGKLAELQAQQMEREIVREERRAATPKTDPALILAPSIDAIEAGVRNVYDRIDAIERNVAVSSGDFEKLTSEMAAFTQAMTDKSAGPDVLAQRLDILVSRLDGLDQTNGDVAALKTDMAALKHTVLDAMEPRFNQLKGQIEALSDRIVPVDTTRVESQLKALMDRMDEAGAQLDGLSRLYAAQGESPDIESLATMVAERTSEAMTRKAPAPVAMFGPESLKSIEDRLTGLIRSAGKTPDYDQLADLVASRTSEAMSKSAPVNAGVNDDNMAALEKRMTAVLNTAGKETAERLARLEAILTERNTPAVARKTEPAPAPEAIAPAPAPARRPAASAAAAPAPSAADQFRQAMSPAEPEPSKLDSILAGLTRDRRDAMPANPADEAPLVDRGFKDAVAPRGAAEAGPENTAPKPPRTEARFDPSTAEKPPRPRSSFADLDEDPFAPKPQSAPGKVQAEPVAASSTSTFVAAARRAQRSKQEQEQPAKPVSGDSLISRALARVRPRQDADAADKVDSKVETKAEARAARAAKQEPVIAEEAVATKREPRAAKPAKPAKAEKAERKSKEPLAIPDGDQPPSFLVRHRRPLLLAATLVAVSMLALNLVMQRMNTPATPAPAAAPSNPAASDDVSSIVPPRVIEMIDPTSTGSINPGAPMSFSGPQLPATTPVPPALLAATTSQDDAPETAPGEIVTGSIGGSAAAAMPQASEAFALPPETVGPLELREAAANGSAQAQFEVAAIFSEGRLVEKNAEEAARWYERSAAQGFAPAQYRLGNLYEVGNGVEKDLEQARLWYQRAAEAGNRMAMHNLAALYAGGQLGDQQFELAAEWFARAADRGMTDSQFNLGMLYARGLGVEQDFEQSYRWFSLAARSGDKDAGQARDDIAKSLSADAVKRINDETGAWKAGAIDLAANFAPIGAWTQSFDPGQPIGSKDVVTKVQQVLARLGFDIGTPDGVAGPKTAEAIKAFERATGMSESGKVNPRLLAVLGSQPV